MVDLSTFRIPFNYVLIKPEPHHKEFVTASGFTLAAGFIETGEGKVGSWESKFWGIKAEVLAVCERIRYHAQSIESYRKIGNTDEVTRLTAESSEFLPHIEVSVGDNVRFHYREYITSTNEGRRIEVVDHGLCMLVPYTQLFSCNDKPINGWVWIKRQIVDTDIVTKSGIFIAARGSQILPIAEVVGVASPVQDYLSEGDQDHNINPVIGSKIFYNVRVQTPLEHEYFQTDGLHDYWKIRRKDIYYVLDNVFSD